MKYTEKQRVVIECKDSIVQVGSPPGSGKTATIFGCIEEQKDKKFLVLCFNASIREELVEKAIKKEIKNAEFYTFHGFAYNFFLKNPFIENFRNREMVDNLDVFEIRKIMKKLEIEYSGIKELVDIKKRLGLFFSTKLTSQEYFQDNKEPYSTILNYLLKDKDAPMFHSFYIKVFQLMSYSNTKYDITLVDEAQDMSSCYISIVENLKTAQLKYFGDKYQMIYSFNGAVGMEKISHFLDRSFRLGEVNAHLCSLILKKLINNDTPGFIGVNKKQNIVDVLPQHEQRTIICRTNKTILGKILGFKKNNRKCYIIGGKESLGLDTLKRMLIDLEKNGKTFYKGFIINCIRDIVKLAKTTNDSNLKNIANAIIDFKLDTQEKVQHLLTGIIDDKEIADYVLTTVHKSKGLEFANVEIADDFKKMEELLGKRRKGEDVTDEAYVLYVATSRSYGNLKLNIDLKYWFKEQELSSQDEYIQLAI